MQNLEFGSFSSSGYQSCFSSRTKSLEARGLIFWKQALHLCQGLIWWTPKKRPPIAVILVLKAYSFTFQAENTLLISEKAKNNFPKWLLKTFVDISNFDSVNILKSVGFNMLEKSVRTISVMQNLVV